MRNSTLPERGGRSLHAAFTLVELLIVMAIIAVLAALVSPAVMTALDRTKTATVQAEIAGLSAAMEAFKAEYGVYPPSSITLSESGGTAWNPRDKRILKKMFGLNVDFSDNPSGKRDFNGDGDKTDKITLNGPECLVFFLGGMPEISGDTWVLTGFSKNKNTPFKRSGNGRNKFFAEWDAGRLTDDDDTDGMPKYTDIFNDSTAYQYNRANNGGYTGVFYDQGKANSPWKANSFQIISPGRDGEIGNGGTYTIDDGPMDQTDANGDDIFDANDNITNFAAGTLKP